MVLKSALITICLLAFTVAGFGQGFVAQLINQDPIMTVCGGGDPIPDGVAVLIFGDFTVNGPSEDDEQPPIGPNNGECNFNTFTVNGAEHGIGEGNFITFPDGWEWHGSLPPVPFFYLMICLNGLHYYSPSFQVAGGFQEIFFGAAFGRPWNCVNESCDILQPPSMPTNVAASDDLCTGITVTWDHDSDDVCGFRVLRNEEPIVVVDDLVFSYHDGAAPVGELMYRVKAIRCGAEEDSVDSPASAEDEGSRIAGPPTPILHSVTNLEFSPQCDVVLCTLSVSTVLGLDSVAIYRGDPGVLIGYVLILTAGQLVEFVDEDPLEGPQNYFAVGYSDACDEGEEVSAILIGEAAFAPQCDVSPVVASTDDCDGVLITWNCECDDADGFNIYRNQDLIATVLIDDDPCDEYFDDVPAPGIDTGYRVIPFNECGEGEAIDPVIGMRAAAPGDVANVDATDDGCVCVTITWTLFPDEDGIVDYGIYRDDALIGSVAPDVDSFDDCTALAGVEYTYCVTASNECGEGSDDGCDSGGILESNGGGATLASVSAGPPDWDYELTWVSGCVNRLVIRDLCEGTVGAFTGDDWTVTTYGADSVVWETETTPLGEDAGSVTGFRLSNDDEGCIGDGRWSAGDEGGLIEGPLPIDPGVSIPDQYALAVYPNPFNPSTNLNFALPLAGLVQVNVYDVMGRLVREVVDKTYEAGYHNVVFDASGLPSGLYFARINSGSFITTKKLMLVK